MRLHSDGPSTSGIIQSTIASVGALARSRWDHASPPSRAATTSNPHCRRLLPRISRAIRSSSAIKAYMVLGLAEMGAEESDQPVGVPGQAVAQLSDRIEPRVRGGRFERAGGGEHRGGREITGGALQRVRLGPDLRGVAALDGAPNRFDPARTVFDEHLDDVGEQVLVAAETGQ